MEGTHEIESIVDYTAGKVAVQMLSMVAQEFQLVKERRYYDESDGGGELDTYYLELTKEQYEWLRENADHGEGEEG